MTTWRDGLASEHVVGPARPKENRDEKDPDLRGSRAEPSGRGYFPGEFNGADVTVKDSKRYAQTGSTWGYYNFNHHEPKAPTAKVRPKTECAFCHQASAKKDEGLDAILSPAGLIRA